MRSIIREVSMYMRDDEYQDFKQEAQRVREAIKKYNDEHPEEPIRFIHGGTSAPLAMMGLDVTVSHPKRESFVTRIPDALIPTGVLRKQYGIYPVSGERGTGTFGFDGERKEALNYKCLSGMAPDHQNGISLPMQYSHAPHIDVERMNQSIRESILEITPYNFIEPLKEIHMKMTSLKQFDPNANEKIGIHLRHLKLEREQLELSFAANPEKLEAMRRYFDKYESRFERIANGLDIPFMPNDTLKEALLNQIPVIYCSTVSGDEAYTDMHEIIHEGSIPFETVKFMLTPLPYVEQLRNLLSQKGLTGVEVIGFRRPEYHEEESSLLKSFKEVNDLETMDRLISKNPESVDGSKNQEFLTTILNYYLDKYQRGLGDQYLDLSLSLIKKALLEPVNNVRIFSTEILNLGDDKLSHDPHYFDKLSQLIPEYTKEGYLRAKEAKSLNLLLTICSVGAKGLFDYRNNDITQKTIESAVRGLYCVQTYSSITQAIVLYEVYQRDLRNPHNSSEENAQIRSRMAAVKDVFLEDLGTLLSNGHQIIDDKLDERIVESSIFEDSYETMMVRFGQAIRDVPILNKAIMQRREQRSAQTLSAGIFSTMPQQVGSKQPEEPRDTEQVNKKSNAP